MPPSWFYQLCDHANGMTRRVIACSHWLTFLPSCQIWFAVMPLRFNEGGGVGRGVGWQRTGIDLLWHHTRKGLTWISVHITWFCRSWETAGWHSWRRKKKTKWLACAASRLFHLSLKLFFKVSFYKLQAICQPFTHCLCIMCTMTEKLQDGCLFQAEVQPRRTLVFCYCSNYYALCHFISDNLGCRSAAFFTPNSAGKSWPKRAKGSSSLCDARRSNIPF